jgi:hypothetical protein
MRRDPAVAKGVGTIASIFKGALVTSLLSAIVPVVCADEPPPESGPRCEIAVVNPVSNYAECVKPRGAHVEPPPRRAPPSEEECRKHPDLEVEACRRYSGPEATAAQP